MSTTPITNKNLERLEEHFTGGWGKVKEFLSQLENMTVAMWKSSVTVTLLYGLPHKLQSEQGLVESRQILTLFVHLLYLKCIVMSRGA